jgi:hypothetical protein
MNKRLSIVLCTCVALSAAAQGQKGVVVTGSIQSDMLVPENDNEIEAEKSGDFLTNTYVELELQSRHVDAGARLEYLEHPLPGFQNEFEGWGVPNFWVKGRLANQELTVGTFYEQFGSGFILRTYEERSLGIDNSLLGGRIVLRPAKGVTLKALSGKQRRYWSWNGGLVSGADAEVSIDEWMPSLQQHDTRLTLGASWVNKYEKDEDIFADPTHRYNLPEYVNAWDVRANLNHGPLSLLVEYAQKTQDPSFDNGYSYHNGHVAMFSGSYSKHGLSVLLQAKRSENMSFRSKRSQLGSAGYINHLPAFTLDHTYTLAALYPYATQLASGEWAYQTEVGYNFKRKTAIGGRYGMNVKMNFSYVRAINDGWLKWGDQTYYQDFNVQLTRRLTHDLKLNMMYMNQRYNMTVIEGGDGGMIHSDIFVADAMYQIASKTRLRGELQYLSTKDDEGDWAFGLLELSLAPHWMFTVNDQWNCGETKTHYYQGLVTYNQGAHRIQAGYGRTQAGFNCSGGVCRYVPATKGFTLSYNYNF